MANPEYSEALMTTTPEKPLLYYVEDDDSLKKPFTREAQNGNTVRHFPNGLEALIGIRNDINEGVIRTILAVIDNKMPVMTGLELLGNLVRILPPAIILHAILYSGDEPKTLLPTINELRDKLQGLNPKNRLEFIPKPTPPRDVLKQLHEMEENCDQEAPREVIIPVAAR